MNSTNELLATFKIIAKKRWIEGVNNDLNSVGLTFEKQLNKEVDSLYFPDYKGIEIKCTQRYSKYEIGLFSMSFDGPTLYETNNLLTKYGKVDSEFTDRKILMANLKVNKKVLVNNKYYFELIIDETNSELYLNIYNYQKQLIEKSSYINIDNLKERLKIKLDKMALVWASKKIENNNKFFRYYKIEFFELISTEKFIELLSTNVIKTSLICRVSRKGNEKGRQKNKGLVFYLPKSEITQLFNNTLTYNYDEKDVYNNYDHYLKMKI